jgi:hypothetical protein
MPDEVENNRNTAAHQDSRRKYVPYRRNADEEDRHTAEGENRSGNASSNRYFRHVDLRGSDVFFHRGTFWL